ncbi:MAG TPA: hypothetical protein DCM67_07240 [Propionibacteriaceae bacterium]|nr:hypothetical protein [Propionibacteriaceae bacterium]
MSDLVSAIPPGTLLLQIGPFKTGTTALQHTAAVRRDALLEQGVLYPGDGLNHRWGCSALAGLSWGWSRAERQSADTEHGDNLLGEIHSAAPSTRVWISYERLATLDDAAARSLCDQFGGPIHVLIGLRPLHSLLPSEWQQLIKSGRHTGPLDQWALDCLDRTGRDESRTRHFDHAALVERWAAIVGPDSVTGIIIDPAHRDTLPRVTEQLLALPDGFLDPPEATQGFHTNRSLTAPELALVSAVSQELRSSGTPQATYQRYIARGLVVSLLNRRPAPEEPRIRLGTEPLEQALAQDRRATARLRASGVRIVGDLDHYGPAQPPPSRPTPTIDPLQLAEVPVDIATAAVVGILNQAADRPQRSIIAHLRRAVRWRTRRIRYWFGRRRRDTESQSY